MSLRIWPLLLILTPGISAQTAPPAPLVPTDPSRLPPAGVSVSMRDLLMPSKAVKELERSQSALRSGDTRASARHLEKALQIYPHSLQAHNSLGARYIELHEYEKAAAEFQKAIELDPHVMQPFNNLSVALFLLQRYSDAEFAARRALALEPRDATSRYMLGCILVTDKRNPQEAMEMLHQTEDQFPDSRLLIAQILERQGAVAEAANQLRAYLKLPHPEKKENVERWLARLNK